jgi:SAM-dependent methyltransferase
MIYDSVNPIVFDQIPPSAKRILDIGCGSGALGRAIKSSIDCEVIGITYSEAEAEIARNHIDKVIVADLNNIDFSTLDLGQIDCIVCSHVLEHLCEPQKLLQKLQLSFGENFQVIVALPNVLNWRQRLKFLKGEFRYTEGGLMDQTHFRFFDCETAFSLLENSGYEIVSRTTDGYFPLPGIRNIIRPLAKHIDRFFTLLMPGMFGVQFVSVARPLSSISHE